MRLGLFIIGNLLDIMLLGLLVVMQKTMFAIMIMKM